MNRTAFIQDADTTRWLGIWQSKNGWAKVTSVAKSGTSTSVAYIFKSNSEFRPYATEMHMSIKYLEENFDKVEDPPKINWTTDRQMWGSRTMTHIAYE